MLKAVVIEDEKTSRETLVNYITKYCNNVAIVGEGFDVKSGLLVIKKYQPDIVYLDIEMPFGNGFDLLEQIASKNEIDMHNFINTINSELFKEYFALGLNRNHYSKKGYKDLSNYIFNILKKDF